MSEQVGQNDRLVPGSQAEQAYKFAVAGLQERIEKLPTPDLDYPDEKQAYLQKWGPLAERAYEQDRAGWKQAEEHRQQVLSLLEENKLLRQKLEHIHGPFTFIMNQNHNALRGCTTCGAAWVGLMAGTPDTLHWHPVAEIEEEEEE